MDLPLKLTPMVRFPNRTYRVLKVCIYFRIFYNIITHYTNSEKQPLPLKLHQLRIKITCRQLPTVNPWLSAEYSEKLTKH